MTGKSECLRIVPINVRSLSGLPRKKKCGVHRSCGRAVSIGSFELSRWRCGGRGGLWDFNPSVLVAGRL
jgi:hypothetical protein